MMGMGDSINQYYDSPPIAATGTTEAVAHASPWIPETRVEYMVKVVNTISMLERMLNEWTAQGWEYEQVSIIPNTTQYIIVFSKEEYV